MPKAMDKLSESKAGPCRARDWPLLWWMGTA